MKQLILFLISTFCLSFYGNAQLYGTIKDDKGEPLPFASIVVEGTSWGTSSNQDGQYSLKLDKGTYKVIFQYVGYEKRVEQVKIEEKLELNIQLQPSSIELAAFEVKANAEDPAYRIIRNVIEKRPFHLNQVPTYSVDVYIKGLQRIVDAPKKFMGKALGDMGGSLDTATRSGIVYLSETISKLHVQKTAQKELLIHSKVSGNNNGLGFNRATLFNFNFYENFNNDLPRKLMSPIADNALMYYQYRLISSEKSAGQKDNIYKIEVKGKRNEDPVWNGYLYVVDNQWNLYATDLYTTKKNLQNELIDTFNIKQQFVPLDEGVWRLLTQTASFKLSLFSLHFDGYFTGIFSNYDLKPAFSKDFFNNETFNAKETQTINDLQKWDAIRPIPLSIEELKDYKKKDSLLVIRQSKPYIDSVYKQSNRFKPMQLLSGYTYRNQHNFTSWAFDPILSTISFNAVQGLHFNIGTTFQKRFKEDLFKQSTKDYEIGAKVNYSLAENVWRSTASFKYVFDYIHFPTLHIALGRKVAPFNTDNPVDMSWAALSALFEKQHVYYIYDKTFFQTGFSKNLRAGLNVGLNMEWAKRTPLEINSQYSFLKKDIAYNDNIPVNEFAQQWDASHLFSSKISLKWTPKQLYSTYANRRILETSKFPTFGLVYEKAFSINTNYASFDKLNFSIKKENIGIGLVGDSEINLEYGAFLSERRLSFMDLNHFNGNELSVIQPLNPMQGFYKIGFYQQSTTDSYLRLNYQHHFRGFFLDKIPLIRKLGIQEVARVAYLNTKDFKNYSEISFGFENIGFGLFRILRVDFVQSFNNWKPTGRITPMFGIGLGLNAN